MKRREQDDQGFWARIGPAATATLAGIEADPSPFRASAVRAWASRYAAGRGDSTISLTSSSALPAAAGGPSLAIGERAGRRYRILRFLAGGAVGEVYAAYDEELGASVALKILRAERAADGLALARFRREVLLGRGLADPGVCRVFDLGVHEAADGSRLPFLTMELLAGETLAQRLARTGPLSPDEALALAEKLASALAAVHDAGVVHRDLKPANIMLVPDRRGGIGRVAIIDFGLARRMGGAADPGLDADSSGEEGSPERGCGDAGDVRTTATGALVGSPAYMAPEQVAGCEVGRASDIYAVGVVLFEAVTGRLPFEGESILSVLSARLDRDAPAVRSIRPELDPRWDTAVAGCLVRDPARRLARALDIPRALTAPIALDRPAPGRGARLAAVVFWRRRHRRPAG